ncbi:hypothetical protein [Mucilaginibacter myungsuensis]|uniref:Uncharacterized protein n=1 Tax=Mucilaginibacter myungsuensis TaxID=649104 RepID=A0A929PYA0_9SPHI|nr:hypothetical protein [Mucilaginibacter myungsuensis]MBE9663230.1 hypothetical protein [Mucilaginibacter myungsuensis]MDN3598863.1 hypothetical protein [Mucilaginibacter myungsuensis]
MKATLYTILFAALVEAGCKKDTTEQQPAGTVMITGVLEVQGPTTYQYGTHTIGIGNRTFSLRSSTVKLEAYNDKTVTITGKRVNGYPVEGGPVLLEVSSVRAR